MTVLPIVERELRVAARRRGVYLVRTIFALVAIVIGIFVYSTNRHSSQREFGSNLFGGLLFLALFYCLFAGLRLTADCLSREKREGTFGLLFLTNLKGYDVVLGKLAATSLSGLFGVLAIMPVMAVPLLMGGMTNGEFWRIVLALLVTFICSLACGVFSSAISISARKALFLTFGLLLLFTAILPALAGLILALIPSHKSPAAEALLWTSSFYAITVTDDSEYRRASWHYWASITTIHGLSWLLLAFACFWAPRSWRDRSGSTKRRRFLRRYRDWSRGQPAQRLALRRRMLNLNAYCWLAGRSRLGPASVWFFVGMLVVAWILGFWMARHEWFNDAVNFAFAIGLNCILKVWIALVAGNQLAEDKNSGAMELLLSTPMQQREILRGQWLALVRQFLWPLIFVLGVELIFLAASVRHEYLPHNSLTPMTWLAGIIVMAGDVVALVWIAMWMSLIAKSSNGGFGLTCLIAFIVPWIAYVIIAILVTAIRHDSRLTQPNWQFFVGLWFGLGILTDLVAGVLAWWQLRTNFLQIVLQGKVGLFARLRQLLKRRADSPPTLPQQVLPLVEK